MAFFRKFSKKGQAADKPDTPVEEMRSHFHISQLEVPPKAYTYGEGPLLRESETSQPVSNLSTDTYGRLPTNRPASPGGPSIYQERRYREKVTNLVEENNRLRVENAELKANLEKESDKHMTTLEYWVKAEKQLGELLRACQTRPGGRWGHADYYEEDNDVGDIGEESESTEEGYSNPVVKP